MVSQMLVNAYLNDGGLRSHRVALAEGLGIHEGELAPVPYDRHLMMFGNSTTQPWFHGMLTNLPTYHAGVGPAASAALACSSKTTSPAN